MKFFALENAGDITRPFQTAYGFNIVKLISATPVNKNENDVVGLSSIQEKVQTDNRLGIAKDNLISKWFSIIHYKKYAYNAAELLKFTDSSLAGKHLLQYKSIQPTTVLFEFEKQQFTAQDFVKYISATGAAAIDSTALNQLLKSFVKRILR